MKSDTVKLELVNGKKLLKILFPYKDCRPSIRWLQRKQKNRVIPYIKMGRHVYFDVHQVREKLEKQNVIRPI